MRWVGHVATMGGEGRAKLYTEFWWGNVRVSEHMEDPGVDGRIIWRWIFRKWDVGVWTESMWLRIGTGLTVDLRTLVMRPLRHVISQKNWYPSDLPLESLLFNNLTESPFTGIWQVGCVHHLPFRISSWTFMWAFGMHASEDQRGRLYFKELQEAAADCWWFELLSIRPQRLRPLHLRSRADRELNLNEIIQ
jgi:hypothetical protein